MGFIGAEEDIAHRIMRQHGADPSNDGLAQWITLGVKAGLQEAALVKPEAQLPEQTKESLGGERTLTYEDLGKLDSARRQVFDILKDGKAHLLHELLKVGGTSAGRRARALRPLFFIDAARDKSRKTFWWYTMKLIVGENYGNLDVFRLMYATPEEIVEQKAKNAKNLERARRKKKGT